MAGYGEAAYGEAAYGEGGGAAVAPATTVPGGLAVELDAAPAGATIVILLGGIASEVDSATSGSVAVRFIIAGGIAVEGETALGGSVSQGRVVVGGTSVESDTAVAGAVATVIAGAVASELDTGTGGAVVVAFRIPGGIATEAQSALHGIVAGTGAVDVLTVRWQLIDPMTDESYVMPINPDSMGPLSKKARTLTHGRGPYGVTSLQQTPKELSFDWGGAIRSQAHYDALLAWASKSNAVIVTDHVGRQFRIFITDFQPTDRTPIPRAPKRWRYTMKSKLLEAL